MLPEIRIERINSSTRKSKGTELKWNVNLYIVIIKGEVSSLGNFQIRKILEDSGTIMQSKKGKWSERKMNSNHPKSEEWKMKTWKRTKGWILFTENQQERNCESQKKREVNSNHGEFT